MVGEVHAEDVIHREKRIKGAICTLNKRFTRFETKIEKDFSVRG